MLSQKTLRHIEIVHELGNWMLVSPISMNIGKLGIDGNCKVVYKGWKWQWFSWGQIICRILTLAYLSVKLLLNSDTILFEFVLFMGVSTMVVIGTNIQISFVSQAESWVAWLNKFFRLKQHLRM